MKYFLWLLCLILYSCPVKEKIELENSSCTIRIMQSSSSILFSSSSVWTDPLILECPTEDVAEYPNPGEPPPIPPNCCDKDGKMICAGYCIPPKASVEELSFGKQGGVRCVTMSDGFLFLEGRGKGCRSEYEIVSEPPNHYNINRFKKVVCPWFTAMIVDKRVIHISANQNETENKREVLIIVSAGDCASGFTITQSTD